MQKGYSFSLWMLLKTYHEHCKASNPKLHHKKFVFEIQSSKWGFFLIKHIKPQKTAKPKSRQYLILSIKTSLRPSKMLIFLRLWILKNVWGWRFLWLRKAKSTWGLGGCDLASWQLMITVAYWFVNLRCEADNEALISREAKGAFKVLHNSLPILMIIFYITYWKI